MTQLQQSTISEQIQATESRLRDTELLAGIPSTIKIGGVVIDITSWPIPKLVKLDRPKLDMQIAKLEQEEYEMVLEQKRRDMLEGDPEEQEFWDRYVEFSKMKISDEYRNGLSSLKQKRVDAMYNLVYHIINDDTSNPAHQLDWIKENLNTIDGMKLIDEHEKLNDLDAFIDRGSNMMMVF